MNVARRGPSKPEVPRLIAEVASASAPAGPKRGPLSVGGAMRLAVPLGADRRLDWHERQSERVAGIEAIARQLGGGFRRPARR